MRFDPNNPPAVLSPATLAFRALLRETKGAQVAWQRRIAAIQANGDLSAEKKARDVAEERAALLAFFDANFRAVATRVAEATSAIEAAVERKADPDPFAPPDVDLRGATAGESALAALTRASIAASARAAEQVAAQRADTMLAAAIARDPVGGPAKLRRELADSGDRVLERALDRAAPRHDLAPGARELLEWTQAEIRDSRLDEPLRELVSQASELTGLAEFLVGLRADLAEGDFIATGRSPVLTALELTFPGIAE